MLRATRAVLADQNADPAQHAVTPWFGAHAALGALPSGTRHEVVLAAQAIATHYAERECERRAAVEGLPDSIAAALGRHANRMQRALATTLSALERLCDPEQGEKPSVAQAMSRVTP